MIKALEQLFSQLSNNSKTTEGLSTRELNLATAALLIEVAMIDQHFDAREWQALITLLVKLCHVTREEAEGLATEGKSASKNAASLYEFTQLINRQFKESQKITLIESLWTVAYADGTLDKYEEHMIRRIADLLHVRHKDFIQTKIQARGKSDVQT